MLSIRAYEEQLSQKLADGLQGLERELGPDVARIRFSLGEDWSGDPAIFFRVLVCDEAAKKWQDLPGLMGRISRTIIDVLRLDELDYIPYFNFRSQAEQDQFRSPEWD